MARTMLAVVRLILHNEKKSSIQMISGLLVERENEEEGGRSLGLEETIYTRSLVRKHSGVLFTFVLDDPRDESRCSQMPILPLLLKLRLQHLLFIPHPQS